MEKDCSDRHPKTCRYWSGNKSWCARKLNCDFLHVTLVRDDGKATIEYNVDDEEFNCVSCKDCWTDKMCVVEHTQNNHMVYFCLNCNDWVKNKSAVLDPNWALLDEGGNLRSNL